MIAHWRELLSRCPAGALGREGSVRVAETVAALAENLIADRDEHTASHLIQAALPHLMFLGRCDPAVLEVRRTWAEALSELGRHRHAETKLRRLSEAEQRVFGLPDPRTTLLLLWALVGQGRLREAEDGFRSLQDRLLLSQGPDSPMLWHLLQCRRAWMLGQQGLGRLLRLQEAIRFRETLPVLRQVVAIDATDKDGSVCADVR